MRGAELYDRVINWPGLPDLAIALGVSVALIMLAALLLSIGRLRNLARVLGVLGVVAIMVTLFVIHEQTVKQKTGEFVTVTSFRYPEATRFQIRVALLGLPAAAAAGDDLGSRLDPATTAVHGPRSLERGTQAPCPGFPRRGHCRA